MQINRKLTGIIFFLFMAMLIFIYWKVSSKTITGGGDSFVSKVEDKIPFFSQSTPTPFLFQEITIPQLRSRTYESDLNIAQKIGENTSYESYLASYNSDGLKVNGLLTKPKGEMPEGGWPGIVFVHGYIPPKEYRTRVNYVNYIEPFARQGFVVFKIDLRGHDQSGGEAGGAYYSGDYVVDTLNAYSALGNSDFVNEEKIGLWGHSMAGNVTFRSFVVKKNIPATVIWAGAGYTYTDLQDYMIDDNSYKPPPAESEVTKKRQQLRDMYGTFDEEHWFWKQVPPTSYLEGVNGAVQLNHAKNDNVVSIEYSRNLKNKLAGTTIAFELNEYGDGGHNLTGNSFIRAMEKSVEFFTRNLK